MKTARIRRLAACEVLCFVLLSVSVGFAQHADHPYDVVPGACCASWSSGGAVDVNGFPFNPLRKAEKELGIPPSSSMCGGGKQWREPCTSQTTYEDTNVVNCPAGPKRSGNLDGHANWWVATYAGKLYWQGHSVFSNDILADDDYQINLQPENEAGQPVGGSLEIEFDSGETVDYFKHGWWDTFHQNVDAGDAQARSLIDGHDAIVIGLFGLDCYHTCTPEVHPVLAIAIRVKKQVDLSDDEWAVFARNWGNEGYCSSGREVANWMTTVSFELPMLGASAVDWAPGSILYGRGTFSGPPILVPGKGAFISFGLAPNSTDNDDLVYGDLHYQWTVPRPQARQRPVPVRVLPHADEPERLRPGAGIRAAQIATYLHMLPSKAKKSELKPICLVCKSAIRSVPRYRLIFAPTEWVREPRRDRMQRLQTDALHEVFGNHYLDNLRPAPR